MSSHRRGGELVLAIAVVLSLGRPACAGVWRSPAAVKAAGAPFELIQVPAIPCAESLIAGDGLSIEYSVHNVAAETLTHIGIEVVSLSPAGQVKAYQIHEHPLRIEPGERIFSTYTSSQVHVGSDDRLVILPYSARGEAVRWRVPDEEFTRRTFALKPEQGDVAPTCRLACLEPSFCKTCSCGVSESFCAVDASGALTMASCTCVDCPAARP